MKPNTVVKMDMKLTIVAYVYLMKNTVVQGTEQNNRKELITAVAARYKCFNFC